MMRHGHTNIDTAIDLSTKIGVELDSLAVRIDDEINKIKEMMEM